MKKVLVLLSFAAFLVGCQQVEKPNVVAQLLNQGWTLTGDTLDINMQVDVPSVVQQSLYDNGLIPHPYLGTVENQLLWISDHPWDYTLRFNADKDLLGKENIELEFEGIDTYAEVKLNGEKLFFADNQFRVWKHEVKDLKKKRTTLTTARTSSERIKPPLSTSRWSQNVISSEVFPSYSWNVPLKNNRK